MNSCNTFGANLRNGGYGPMTYEEMYALHQSGANGYGGRSNVQPYYAPQCAGSDYDRGYSAGEAAAAVLGAAAVVGFGYWLYKNYIEKQ